MARMNVNPTRMELKRLREQLSTATKGHKLLKDKSDEMIRRFSELLKENKRLRDEVEEELSSTLSEFSAARGVTPSYDVETAFSMPSAKVDIECETGSIMGVPVPQIEMKESGSNELPYSYTEITSEADGAVKKATDLLPKMIRLAEIEKSVRLLSYEIERNKRRVNALEYVMIPQLEETIKNIRDKLEENERASRDRLMKVK